MALELFSVSLSLSLFMPRSDGRGWGQRGTTYKLHNAVREHEWAYIISHHVTDSRGSFLMGGLNPFEIFQERRARTREGRE